MPTKERSKDEFFQKIFNELQDVRPINAQTAAEAVFGTLSRHVREGEIEGVKASPAGGYPRGPASIGAK